MVRGMRGGLDRSRSGLVESDGDGSCWLSGSGGAMVASVTPRLRVGFVEAGMLAVERDFAGGRCAFRPLTALADSGTSPRCAGRGGAGGGVGVGVGAGVGAGTVSALGMKLAIR